MCPRRPATCPSSVLRALVEREMPPISHKSCWRVEKFGEGLGKSLALGHDEMPMIEKVYLTAEWE